MDHIDFIGDLALTLLGVMAMLALWTGALGTHLSPVQRATCAVAAMGWSILVGRWIYAASRGGDWISAVWPSQAGLILIAIGSISAGVIAVRENARREQAVMAAKGR